MNTDLAEKSILGSMLHNNHLINELPINEEHLASAINRTVLIKIKSVYEKHHAVDPILLMTTGELDDLGGANYITELYSMANEKKVEEYSKVVLDGWKKRKTTNILQMAIQESWDAEKVQKELTAVEIGTSKQLTSIIELCTKYEQKPWKAALIVPGVMTGVSMIDEMTGGLQKAELTIVAARPSVGKTDVLLKFASTAGKTSNRKVIPIIFSLEMPEEKLFDRLIATEALYNRTKLRDPYKMLDDKQKDRWYPALGILSKTNILIDDTPGLTVRDMKAKARRVQQDNPNAEIVIYVDYLTIIEPDETMKSSPRSLQVGSIANDLKKMAKELNCSVCCLAQLSRGVEQRSDKRPMLSDLRDSGEIEQIADTVIFLYRDSYYEKTKIAIVDFEFNVAKQRNGPTGVITTDYNQYTGEIKNAKREGAIA